MTLQEQIDNHKTIVYRGYENGETLLSFDDEKEIYRFSDKEVKEVTDHYKTPEELEFDKRMENTSKMVYEELKYRRCRNMDNIRACFVFLIGFIVFAVASYSNGHHLAALVFLVISLLGLLPLPKLFHTRKVLKDYFDNKKLCRQIIMQD